MYVQLVFDRVTGEITAYLVTLNGLPGHLFTNSLFVCSFYVHLCNTFALPLKCNLFALAKFLVFYGDHTLT